MAWALAVGFCVVAALWSVGEAGAVTALRENYLPDYRHYHNVSAVHRALRALSRAHPDRVLLHRTFASGQRRPIPVLRLPPQPSPGRPLRVLLVFGEHPREFLPVESSLHLLRGLLARPGAPLSRLLRRHFDLYLIPLLNPDGRRVIERTGNYCWRGTAAGVDLERNFPWEFGHGGGGSSADRRDEEFRGSEPFSEPESRAIRDLSAAVQFDASVSFHSGIRHIYIPFSDSRSRASGRRPPGWALMTTLASRVSAAMGTDPRHAFKAGPAAQLNDYASDGTLFDYMAGVRRVPVSLTIELWGVGDRPGLACFDLLNPRSARLQDELARLWKLYEALFSNLWALHPNISGPASPAPGLRAARSSVPPYPLLALFGCLVLIVGLLCKHRLRSNSAGPWRALASGRKRVISLRSFSSRFSSLASLKSV